VISDGGFSSHVNVLAAGGHRQNCRMPSRPAHLDSTATDRSQWICRPGERLPILRLPRSCGSGQDRAAVEIGLDRGLCLDMNSAIGRRVDPVPFVQRNVVSRIAGNPQATSNRHHRRGTVPPE